MMDPETEGCAILGGVVYAGNYWHRSFVYCRRDNVRWCNWVFCNIIYRILHFCSCYSGGEDGLNERQNQTRTF